MRTNKNLRRGVITVLFVCISSQLFCQNNDNLLLKKIQSESNIMALMKSNVQLKWALKEQRRQQNVLVWISALLIAGATTVFIRTRQLSRIKMSATSPVIPLPELSEREIEILLFVVKGFSHKEIAVECGISYNTVRFHIKNLTTKYKVRSLTELVAVAVRHGI